MFSPARLESLKIQLPVPGLPCIAVVCPRPRAHLSVSEPSRPRRGVLQATSGHPVIRATDTGFSVCFPVFPPQPRAPPPRRSLHKALSESLGKL